MLNALKQNWPFILFITFLVSVSFYFYAPCNSPLYNSDHAVHTLMSNDFTLPRDMFYWGQNRLGSLFPMVSYPIIKFLHIHPLYVVSVINYIFLLIPTLLIASFIKNKWIVLALVLAVFFPANDYYAILYIGHPYTLQFFSGVLFIYVLQVFYSKISSSHDQKHITLIFLITSAMAFYGLGVWISEFNAILILIPFFYILFERKTISGILQKKTMYIYLLIPVSLTVLFYIILHNLKKQAPQDELYKKAFFFEPENIKLQFRFMMATIGDVVFFRDKHTMANLFYYVTLPPAIWYFCTKRNMKSISSFRSFNFSTIVTCLLASVPLFFSTWNLRSDFCPRYYAPVYFMLIVTFLIYLDKTEFTLQAKIFVTVFIIFSAVYTGFFIRQNNGPSALKKFSDFATLPKGTLIAGYWDAYVIGSVAVENLTVFPYHDQFVRNWFAREKGMQNKNFYLLNEPDLKLYTKNDTLYQFGHSFAPSGEKYKCNELEVLHYVKVK